jgi:hypothetical protein
MKPTSTLRATLAFIGALGWGAQAVAAPAITSVQGDFVHGNQIAISGAGFGVKSPAQPYLWAPFEGSIDPSPLGLTTEWTAVQGMAYAPGEGAGGTGGLKATDNSGSWTARLDSDGWNWNDPGQKMYIFKKAKRNFDIWDPPEGVNHFPSDTVINYKIWRLWTAGFKYPNVYLAPSNGSAIVEADPGLESHQSNWPYGSLANRKASMGTVGQWYTNELLVRSNTNAVGPGDGFMQESTDGVVYAESPYEAYNGTRYWKMWDTANPPSMTMNFVVHEVKANATYPSDWRAWADDIYVDTTWARVMIGDAPTLEDSRHREIQIPAAWSDGSITITVNVGTFPGGSTPYLFVIDENNHASPGFPLGEIVATPSAPTNVKAE